MLEKKISISQEQETAVIVGLITEGQSEELTHEYLDELAFLAETAGAKTVKRYTQKLRIPHVSTFVGERKT